MRAFVTGATGGLGRNLCRRLAADGMHCTGMGRDAGAGQWLERQGCRFVALDLADCDGMATA
ncbi:MAG TPA: SDR family NAD(P)-dependent oxidoreductase, partial [Magnetospirillum sp.]|nr:SDR family NAD(P)-dependent oxidoreductase [Magnetospirillum sp.]